MRPEKPKPAENAVPLISNIVAIAPIIAAPIVVGRKSLGLVNILAICILGDPMKCASVPPNGLTLAPIAANVKLATTIPAFAAPDPTPVNPIAVAIPTEDYGETIRKANAAPSKAPIIMGVKSVA